MSTRPARQGALAAFVLHRYEWSESSLIIDLFTRDLGRIAVAARGARKPYSQLRSVLLPFQHVHVGLGRGAGDEASREVHALKSAEWSGGSPMPTGAALWSGFYLNELLLKLIARHDPHPELFDAYADTVGVLAAGGDAESQAALRAFELVLMREIGLLPDLATETATRQPVAARARYRLLGDSGVVAAGAGDPAPDASGAVLLSLQPALAARDLPALRRATAAAGAELRPLLRALLAYHLGDDALRTRRVLRDAQQLDLPASR